MEIGVLRTDVMEDTGNRTADGVIEALGRVGLNETAFVFALEVADVSCAAKA
jgi:hypothetical protein